MDCYMPVWDVPKVLLDSCYPQVSEVNYSERIDSTAPRRSSIYYQAHALDAIVPQKEAMDLARAIAANAPLAVAASKRVVAESREWPRAESFARQAPIADAVRSSDDAREGALAFTEKRAPQWKAK